jgi:hypothetical protein
MGTLLFSLALRVLLLLRSLRTTKAAMRNQETLHPIDSRPRLNAFRNKAMTAMMKKKKAVVTQPSAPRGIHYSLTSPR